MTEEKTAELKVAKIPNPVTVKKFAELLDLSVSAVITELMKNGIMATINEEIDFDTASIIAQDLGYQTEEDLDVTEGEAITLEKLIDICKKEQQLAVPCRIKYISNKGFPSVYMA